MSDPRPPAPRRAPERIRVHKIGSVVYRLALEKDVEITTDLVSESGNAIVVRALNEKRVYSELELANGRMSKIFRGDVLIGALGRRRALRGFAGDVPAQVRPGDVLAVLNRGGVIGGSATEHKDFGLPVACEVVGMPVIGGRIANIRDARLPRVETLTGLEIPPAILVSGTSMDSGKTLFLSELTQQLSKAGVAVAGGKLTGVACLRDLVSLEDHGAMRTASFLDVGHPSTALLGDAELLDIARSVIAELARAEPDIILLELGDGIAGAYGTLALLRHPEIRRIVKMHVFCATDPMGAWGGHRFLADENIEIDLFSGPVTDNSVGVDYLAKTFKKPAINAYRDPEKLLDLVRKRVATRT